MLQVEERVKQAPHGDRTVVVENMDVPAGEVWAYDNNLLSLFGSPVSLFDYLSVLSVSRHDVSLVHLHLS